MASGITGGVAYGLGGGITGGIFLVIGSSYAFVTISGIVSGLAAVIAFVITFLRRFNYVALPVFFLATYPRSVVPISSGRLGRSLSPPLFGPRPIADGVRGTRARGGDGGDRTARRHLPESRMAASRAGLA